MQLIKYYSTDTRQEAERQCLSITVLSSVSLSTPAKGDHESSCYALLSPEVTCQGLQQGNYKFSHSATAVWPV